MRTDAKNQVTAARTIHLPEQKETIHMFSLLRKEACSGSIHDLAHIYFNSELFGRLFDNVIGEGRHFDRSSENMEVIGS